MINLPTLEECLKLEKLSNDVMNKTSVNKEDKDILNQRLNQISKLLIYGENTNDQALISNLHLEQKKINNKLQSTIREKVDGYSIERIPSDKHLKFKLNIDGVFYFISQSMMDREWAVFPYKGLDPDLTATPLYTGFPNESPYDIAKKIINIVTKNNKTEAKILEFRRK